MKTFLLAIVMLALVVPAPARADEEQSKAYIAGYLISITDQDGSGVGGVNFDPTEAQPRTITINDDLSVTRISARVCQDIDNDGTICEQDEPVQDLCVENGVETDLVGFVPGELVVWVNAAVDAFNVFGPDLCEGAMASSGEVTVRYTAAA